MGIVLHNSTLPQCVVTPSKKKTKTLSYNEKFRKVSLLLHSVATRLAHYGVDSFETKLKTLEQFKKLIEDGKDFGVIAVDGPVMDEEEKAEDDKEENAEEPVTQN